ncbi:TetR/AcrR family transcriptional regulator [Nonomuraea sp. NBC_00507]|uniref:hypothetical protein n=1 Tax=Nonomuraea sp. NBC_00507 TaxID=2976002 RepID=UPI002E17BAC8
MTSAAEAHVDKSSVIQYFGTKQQLFREAVAFDLEVDALTVGVIRPPRRTTTCVPCSIAGPPIPTAPWPCSCAPA